MWGGTKKRALLAATEKAVSGTFGKSGNFAKSCFGMKIGLFHENRPVLAADFWHEAAKLLNSSKNTYVVPY